MDIPCSATCGGVKTRQRMCDNPIPYYGEDCEGDDTATATTACDPCPVDGGWGEWSDWGDCQATCGVGLTRVRERFCDSPAPVSGGLDCEGSGQEEELCVGLPSCPSKF